MHAGKRFLSILLVLVMLSSVVSPAMAVTAAKPNKTLSKGQLKKI